MDFVLSTSPLFTDLRGLLARAGLVPEGADVQEVATCLREKTGDAFFQEKVPSLEGTSGEGTAFINHLLRHQGALPDFLKGIISRRSDSAFIAEAFADFLTSGGTAVFSPPNVHAWLESLRLSEPPTLQEVLRNLYVLIASQRENLARVVTNAIERDGGILEKDPLAALGILPEQVGYIWLSSLQKGAAGLAKEAAKKGHPDLVAKIDKSVASGARLVEIYQFLKERTERLRPARDILRASLPPPSSSETEHIVLRWLGAMSGRSVPEDQLEACATLISDLREFTKSDAYRDYLSSLETTRRAEVEEQYRRVLEDTRVVAFLRLQEENLLGIVGEFHRSAATDPTVRESFDLGEGGIHSPVSLPAGFESIGLKVIAPDLLAPERKQEVGLAFAGFLRGDRDAFSGPLASLMFPGRSDWSQFFGYPFNPDTQRVNCTVVREGEKLHVKKAVLYDEKGRPAVVVFPLWINTLFGPVPLVRRLTFSSISNGQVTVKCITSHLQGSVFGEEERTVTVQQEDTDVMRVIFDEGRLSQTTVDFNHVRKRPTLTLQVASGAIAALVPPDYPPQKTISPARAFEDLAGILPLLSPTAQKAIKAELRQILEEIGKRTPDPETREKQKVFNAMVDHSPVPLASLLLDLSQDPQLSLEARGFVSIIVFRRRYSRWGKVEKQTSVSSTTLPFLHWVALVQEKTTGRKVVVVQKDSRQRDDLEKEFRKVFGILSDNKTKWNHEGDVAADVIFSGATLERALQSLGRPVTRENIKRLLEEVVNQVMAEERFSGLRDSLWRISVEMDHGLGHPHTFEMLRNRERYDKNWELAGYHSNLPGESLFACDPALGDIHPLESVNYGYNRFGRFKTLELVSTFRHGHGRVLLAEGEHGKNYHVASVVYPEDLASQGGVRKGLLSAHGELANALSAQLSDRNRWPKESEAPRWNRLRVKVAGYRSLSFDALEHMMQAFAEDSWSDRADLGVERVLVEQTIQIPNGDENGTNGNGNHRVTVLTVIEDNHDMVMTSPSVRHRYFVEAKVPGSEETKTVLVERPVLERFWATGDQRVAEGEYWPATEVIRDKSPLDRRRDEARTAGGTFAYDRVYKGVPEAIRRLWSKAGQTPPKNPVTRVREIFFEEGQFRVAERPAGKNQVGVVAFEIKVKLPRHPKGRSVVLITHDPTHPLSRLGALGFESAITFWLAGEYADQNDLPLGYIPTCSGAKMGLPDEIIPRKKGSPVRISWDPEKGKAYLTHQQMDDLVIAMKKLDSKVNDWESLFRGEWVGERFYPRALLKGGINQLSLRGSALTGGVVARIANRLLTASALLGSYGRKGAENGTGISFYNAVLCRRRSQREGGYYILMGANAANNTYLGQATVKSGTVLYRDNDDLGGAHRLHEEGLVHHVGRSEAEGLMFLFEQLDRDDTDIPSITEVKTYPAYENLSPERVTRDPEIDRDVILDIQVSAKRVRDEYEARRLPAPKNSQDEGLYDIEDLLKGIFDRGSFQRIPGLDMHAVAGPARIGGYRVAGVGLQILPEYHFDLKGRPKVARSPGYKNDTPTPISLPDVNPPMVLTPEGAGDMASFIETTTVLYPWMPVVGSLAAKGYDARRVKESGVQGARLVSAMVHHSAPILLFAPPRVTTLGGMKVTVAKELGMRVREILRDGLTLDPNQWDSWVDEGHIRVYGDPRSFEAVLEPSAWRGINFFIDTERYVMSEMNVPQDVAGKIVLQVIEWMSTFDRAAADGSFTAEVGTDKIRSRFFDDIHHWNQSDRCKRLIDAWEKTKNRS